MKCTSSTNGAPCPQPTYNSNNQSAGNTYDAAGNVTNDGTYGYQWDAEGRLVAITQSLNTVATNIYNALGQNVRHVGSGETTDMAYGAGGNLLWRYTGGDAYTHAFVPFMGRILADYTSPSYNSTIFYHPDQLGSLSTASDQTGNNFREMLYYPFGGLWTGAGTLPMHQTFAQLPDYDNDASSDLYNTLARHYSPMGRWLSPDPGGLNAVKLDDPQTWNMYAYVRNNPTTNIDPDGEDCISTSNQTSDSIVVSVTTGGDCAAGQTYVSGTIDMSSLTYSGTSLGYSFTPYDTDLSTYGFGTLPLGPSQGSSDINPFGLAVIQAVGQRANGMYGLFGAFAGGSILGGGGVAAGLAATASAAGLTTLGLGDEAEAGGASSDYIDVTRPSAKFPNRLTNVTSQEFGDNLQAEGYTKSVEGNVIKYSKGNTQYTVYRAGSTGGPSAQIKVGGKVVGTIRLQP